MGPMGAGVCLHVFEPYFAHKYIKGRENKRAPHMGGLGSVLDPKLYDAGSSWSPPVSAITPAGSQQMLLKGGNL